MMHLSYFTFIQKVAEDSKAGLQSKFQNLNAQVNQMWTKDGQMARTEGQTDHYSRILWGPNNY